MGVALSDATLLIVRGAASLLIGLAAIVWPGTTLVVVVSLAATYALLDGIANLILGLTPTPTGEHVLSRIALGFAGLAIAASVPGLTLTPLMVFIAIWAAVRGALDLVAGARLRAEMPDAWLLTLACVMSFVFAESLFFFPGADVQGITWLLGAYAAAWGGLLLVLGVQLRAPREAIDDSLPHHP